MARLDLQPDAIDPALMSDADKQLAARELLDQLTVFGESIATDASGDGHFDVEISGTIQLARACLLRWISINSPYAKTQVQARIIMDQHVNDE